MAWMSDADGVNSAIVVVFNVMLSKRSLCVFSIFNRRNSSQCWSTLQRAIGVYENGTTRCKQLSRGYFWKKRRDTRTSEGRYTIHISQITVCGANAAAAESIIQTDSQNKGTNLSVTCCGSLRLEKAWNLRSWPWPWVTLRVKSLLHPWFTAINVVRIQPFY